MYKILVIVTSEGGHAVTMETISFVGLDSAKRALSNLNHYGMSGMTVLALFDLPKNLTDNT